MAKTRVGINGFGRIGRNFFRAALDRGGDFEIVAFNDLGDVPTMAHLLKHDSALGHFDGDVQVEGGSLKVNGNALTGLAERDPANLPWRDLGVDVVIESTGFFTSREGAQKHLDAGAKKVVISAPATDPDITLVLGVNDDAVRRGTALDHLERVVHDELRRADGEGARRRVRDRPRVHDDHSRVHAGSAAARRPSQGSSARAQRRDQPDPDLDRRGPRDRPGAAASQGQGRRDLGSGTRRDRVGHGPRRDAWRGT